MTLKSLGYITLMTGDGANDVGALNQTHLSIERLKKVYETQLKMGQRFN